MGTVWRFLLKFASLIVCTLHCFERVIFKGYVAMAYPREIERFVDFVLKVRRSHFFKVSAPAWSDRLVEHAQRFAAKAGRTYLYRTGSFRKDHWAEQRIREQRIDQKLIQFASLTFTPKDILAFLGRKWDRRFDGEVQTEVKTDRVLGTRIKHRMTKNWLKMYDKFGQILRVETVINRPKEFSVFRTRHHRDGTTSQGYFPMR